MKGTTVIQGSGSDLTTKDCFATNLSTPKAQMYNQYEVIMKSRVELLEHSYVTLHITKEQTHQGSYHFCFIV